LNPEPGTDQFRERLQYLFTTAIQLKKSCYKQSAVSFARIGEKSKNTEGIIPRVNSIQLCKKPPLGAGFIAKLYT
jgi:hypothetical protein